MDARPETVLLARCLKGEAEAWDELFDQHYAATGRFVFQLGYQLSREEVEEICQEVFLSVVKNLCSFEGNCRFQTWVFRIAINKARDYQERQHAAKRGGSAVTVSLDQEDPVDGYRIDPPSPLPGPDLSLIRRENADLVGEALERLGGPCREIIDLRYFADLSYAEIAQTLQLHPKTVSSRLSKCLDKLETVLRKLILREKKVSTPV